MNMRLDTLQGWPAVREAIDSESTRRWRALVGDQRKVAVYQSPSFVLTWYELYQDTHEPLLFVARGEGDAITGVMPLAIERTEERRLTFAGAEQAEYEGWVALPQVDEEFPARCVAHLRAGGHLREPWLWKRLSPGTDLRWLEHEAIRESEVGWRTQAQPNPILALDDEKARRFFAAEKSNHKRKTNRLQRLGELRLLRLTAETLTDELLQRFATLCDIRYLARHGVTPFRDDPLKAEFCRRLLTRMPDATFLYVLMAGETPAAFHFDIGDKQRAIFCMSPFDPVHGKASPGKLIADCVVEALRSDGMTELDLTPGDDEYKTEVASRYETVHSIRLFPSVRDARRYDVSERVRKPLKAIALRVGITGDRVERARLKVQRVASRPLPETAANVWLGARRWVWSRDVFMTYYIMPEFRSIVPEKFAEGLEMHDRALEDFLCYTGSNPWLSRQAMMREATRRIERGELSFTLVEDGILLLYGWVQINPSSIRITEVDMEVQLEPGDGAVYDFYTEPEARGRKIYRRALLHAFGRGFEAGAKRIIGGAMETNQASRRGIAGTGQTPRLRLIRTRFLGMTWKRQERIE